jgi:hypothetical protein
MNEPGGGVCRGAGAPPLHQQDHVRQGPTLQGQGQVRYMHSYPRTKAFPPFLLPPLPFPSRVHASLATTSASALRSH